MNRKSRRIVAMLLVLLGFSATTDALGTSFCRGLEGEFSFLYWRPTANELPLAVATAEQDSGIRSVVYLRSSNYDLGYRVGLRYCLPCGSWYGRVAVTWLNAHHTDSKGLLPGGAPSLIDPFGIPITSTVGSSRIRYLTGDLEFGHPVACCRCLALSILGGLRVCDVESRVGADEILADTEVPVTGHYSLRSRFHGVGPRLGFDLRWCICRCWNVVGRLGSSFLFAGRSTRYESSLIPQQPSLTTVTNIDGLTWQLDGKLGLQFFMAWQCLGSLTIEGGVALDHLLSGPTKLAPTSIGTAVQSQAFAVGGPYARVALAF